MLKCLSLGEGVFKMLNAIQQLVCVYALNPLTSVNNAKTQ